MSSYEPKQQGLQLDHTLTDVCVSHSPDLLSETQCHLVFSVLQFVLVALEVPEDLVHPNVEGDAVCYRQYKQKGQA